MRSSLYQASMVAMSRPDMIRDAWKAKWIWFPFHGPPKDGFAGNLTCACRKVYKQDCLFSCTATALVFSLTVMGRRVLPLEGGRGERMISDLIV